MRKILFAATALMLSTAAFAQMPPPGAGPGWNHSPAWDADAFWRGAPARPRDRIGFLQDRLNRSVANGSIDEHEARRVNGQLSDLRHWIVRMHWEDDGVLTPGQREVMQAKLDQISQEIRWARHDGW